MNITNNKNVLIVALEMPPARSAGVQRPYRFAQHLLEMGWNPIILTASENVYQSYDYKLSVTSELKKRTYRAKAFDVCNVLSFAGKTPDIAIVPDRYWPWYFNAVKVGQQLIEKYDINFIWSTYPVMTTHLIARKLSIKNQLPWIADFRDPIQCHYNKAYKNYNFITRFLERKVVESATHVCTTTHEAANLYKTLYPHENKNKFSVIENGFVEFDITKYPQPTKFTLLYSGALYSNGRDISGIFKVLQRLKQTKLINGDNFSLVFRGSIKPDSCEALLRNLDIDELVDFLPAIPFEQAVIEMQQCSANLLIQDEIFKYQIPGKLYDYIQSQKPLLAICPEGSATANACIDIPNCLQVWNEDEIESALITLLSGTISEPLPSEKIHSFSRRARTAQLASLIEKLLAI
jgi:hypothetical protein